MTRGSHILVVDDETDILEVLETLLEAEGYRVRTANGGQTALDLLQDWRPDLILLDLSMPGMDGAAFAAEQRRRFGNATPLILLSARLDLATEGERLGAAATIRKPFDVASLAAVVDRTIRFRRSE